MRKRYGRNARPNAGDLIRVKDHWNDGNWVYGEIVTPMSTQFSWKDKEGQHFYCLYTDDWEHIDE